MLLHSVVAHLPHVQTHTLVSAKFPPQKRYWFTWEYNKKKIQYASQWDQICGITKLQSKLLNHTAILIFYSSASIELLRVPLFRYKYLLAFNCFNHYTAAMLGHHHEEFLVE